MARKTFTSTQVKARWNKKNYDRMAILVPKGMKEEFSECVRQVYDLSMNGFINMKIRQILGISIDQWKPLYKGE